MEPLTLLVRAYHGEDFKRSTMVQIQSSATIQKLYQETLVALGLRKDPLNRDILLKFRPPKGMAIPFNFDEFEKLTVGCYFNCFDSVVVFVPAYLAWI